MRAKDRGIAMVFPELRALSACRSSKKTAGVGLKIRGAGQKRSVNRRVERRAFLELDGLLNVARAETSGGQRQRVAMGRAVCAIRRWSV